MTPTKTIYSICYPETRATLAQFLQNPDIHDWYTQTWSKKQDSAHHEFFDDWKAWVAPALEVNWHDFGFFYPSAGSSEAIREQIVHLCSRGVGLVVFEGEYEGYEAIVNALNPALLRKIPRHDWRHHLASVNPAKEVFFLSQPSSMDGNWWADFDEFMAHTQALQVGVYVDIAYVGAARQTQRLVLDYPHVQGIFFSLSKAFGVYYHRIGGVVLRRANPLLYGNMWFKNLLAMKFGQALMASHPIGCFDGVLSQAQARAIAHLQRTHAHMHLLVPSDVYLIGTVPNRGESWQQEFIRTPSHNAPLGERDVRLCLSPVMEALL